MSWVIKKKDIPYISLGAKFLSCGGGGDPKTTEYLLLSVMNDNDTIVVKTANELLNEWIVPIAMVGSPVLYSEDIPAANEVLETIQLYESVVEIQTDAVISIEIGGINALTPLLVALYKNIPVIDGDGMGRAFPKLGMTTFAYSGDSLFPIAAISGQEKLVATEFSILEEKFNSFILHNKGYCHAACFGMTGYQMKAAMIPGTLKLARNIGEALSIGTLQQKEKSLRNILMNSLFGKMKITFAGRISFVKRWFENKVLVGSCQLTGHFTFFGQKAEIIFQNEFLCCSVNEDSPFTTPDLIVLLRYDNGMPISVSDIREGVLVLVLIVPAPSMLKTKEILREVSPNGFGIPIDYSQIKQEGGAALDEGWG